MWYDQSAIKPQVVFGGGVMGGICWIVGAGDFSGTLPTIGEHDLVIAADAGYRALMRLGVKIDRVVGDFDSLGEVPVHPGVEVHPAEKDETDMMLAIRTALAAGCREVRVYGGLGGRLDHSFANLQALVFLARQGVRGWLIGETNAITAVADGELRFSEKAEGIISVFAADGTARGVTLEGLKYPLTDYTMTADNPIGVSNEFTGALARVAVRDGVLLVMAGEPAPGWLKSGNA
jgi:thiamine pyrophosphokinase